MILFDSCGDLLLNGETVKLYRIPVRIAHSREFVDVFCFDSCKTSQNVAFHIYLHDVNLKFHLNRHYRSEALCFILSDIIFCLMKNLHSCKTQGNCWEKNLKGLRDKVCGFLTNNIDSHSIDCAVYNVYKHWGSETAQYRLEIIFKALNRYCK